MQSNDGDISHTIIAKSDQLNASDLLGGPVTVTVISVKVQKSKDQPVSIQISGGYQPFKPCLTVRRILAKLWTPKSASWTGKSMTLYCDPEVTWAGEKAGGIRVSHMSGINGIQEVTTRASKRSVTKSIIEEIFIELEAYADEVIDSYEADWVKLFSDGQTSPDKLIRQIESKHTLTDDQKTRIKGMRL